MRPHHSELPARLPAYVSAWVAAVQRQPAHEALHLSGQWAARMLIACLCITPAIKVSKAHKLMPLRQTLGLLAFGYSALHAVLYVVNELMPIAAQTDEAAPTSFSTLSSALRADLEKRSYILYGIISSFIMLLLAATSYRSTQVSLSRCSLHNVVAVAPESPAAQLGPFVADP
eukprot:SAG31_NODE_9913_length_1211_cov_1.235612_2_plen_173_part_00